MPEEASSAFSLKRLLVGKPIPSSMAHHERLSRVTGLAVLSSDALSSVAYATDFILTTLVVAGVAAFSHAIPISLVIAGLLAVVAFSYRQTIHAYPTGGGAYIVAKENIGDHAGLTAAASLLVDYTLTVSVSISAGVLAITSAFPALDAYRVEMCLGALAILMLGNLRGIRESGRIFAVPTYFFVVSIAGLLLVGAYKYLTGAVVPVHAVLPPGAGTSRLTLFLLLTAFANGCTAMTGVEAVSNGVPAFRPPEAKNASATLIAMAVIAIAMFVGITVLAHAYGIVPTAAESGVSQLGRAIFGTNIIYYLLQAATTMILVLAANTAYADFPRLASIVARDRYLPRQFMNQGDRLAFSNGILVLSVFAAILIIAFRGDTQRLLPLYMIGVFISFTLSQAGMVIHWRKTRETGWKTSALINGFGAVVTGIVLVIVAITKTLEGAWIVLLLIPAIVLLFKETRTHYDHVARQLTLRGYTPAQTRAHNIVVMPIGGMQRAVVEAMRYAETLSDDVRAVYVDIDSRATEQIKKDWVTWGGKVQLVILQSPYRSVMEPLLDYIDSVEKERPDDYISVILPEFVPARWWQHLLHNQSALLIKGALLFRPNLVVTSVPFHLEH
jgi:amino acid transporter